MKFRIITSLFVAFVVGFVFTAPSVGAFGWFNRYEDVSTSEEYVEFSVSDFKDRKAKYYSLKHNGQEVRFFVIMDKSGVIRAAFDACDVCYKARKGYDQNGEYMICNNCGMNFHVSRINVVKGGCNPAPLKRDYDDATVRIMKKDIMKGVRYFPEGA